MRVTLKEDNFTTTRQPQCFFCTAACIVEFCAAKIVFMSVSNVGEDVYILANLMCSQKSKRFLA